MNKGKIISSFVAIPSFMLHTRKFFTYTSLKIFIFLLPFFGIFAVYAASKHTVYFYNPESNVNNFASLKIRLDTYLKNFGLYKFQPFRDRDTFEKIIQENQDGILLLSSWHYKILREKLSIKPVLVGVVDGKTTQLKVLSSRKNIHDLELLKDGTVASAGSDDYTRNLLRQMLSKDKNPLVDSFQILNVPKDIDALISVGFGLADVALTTESSLDMLLSINPRLYKKLTILAKSRETLLPIVAVSKAHNPGAAKLLEIVENMGKTPDGEKSIQMLGLDGWKVVGEKEMDLLEKS